MWDLAVRGEKVEGEWEKSGERVGKSGGRVGEMVEGEWEKGGGRVGER